MRCIGIEDPWTKKGRVCEICRDIIGMGNRNNAGKFGCLSETKILLIFTERKSDSLRQKCRAWNLNTRQRRY